MVDERPVDLITGESRWLRTARRALFIMAALALLYAPADPFWKGAGMAGLGLIYILLSMNLRRMSRIRSMRLLGDGMLTLVPVEKPEIHASLGKHGWSTAWLTVVPVQRMDHRGKLNVLVCRSRNHPQDYRRLLSRMRLGSGSGRGHGILDRA